MAVRSAVIFVPDDTGKTGYERPMFLQRIMGVPMLSWLVQSLLASGVSRYFLVCLDAHRAEAKNCFPAEAELTVASDAEAADLMHVFLSTAEEFEQEVMVVTGPCIRINAESVLEGEEEAPRRACACRVGREVFMEALDGENFSFSHFLVECGAAYTDHDGMFTVSDREELADWQPILKRAYLYELAHQGVEIWDYDNCYVEPGVRIGGGTVLLPGTIIRGASAVGHDCVIGPNTYLENAIIGNATRVNASQVLDSTIGSDAKIGPFSYIRADSVLENRAQAGGFTELRGSHLGEGSRVAQLAYLGDTDAGRGVQFGAASVTANFDRRATHRTRIEDDAFVGSGASLVAPVEIGRGAYIAAGTTVTEDVPSQALAIGRARQTNKKDWAGKNKR